MTILTQPVRRVEGLWLEDYQTPAKDYLSARASEAMVRNPLPSLIRMGEVEQASGGAQQVRTLDDTGAPLPEEPFIQPRELSPMLSPEEATARGEAMGLSFSQPTRAEVVDILARRKKAEVARQTAVRRGSGGFGLEATALGLDLLVTAADPLNVASAFIPVVREARFATWAVRSSPAVARLSRGAIEGAAGAAIVEPAVLAAATQEQADYDMVDSLLNLAFGTVLGGGLHVGAGALADVAARRAGRPTLSQRLQEAPHAVREAALRTAVAQAMEGRVVDVEPVLSGNRFLDSTSLSTRRQGFEPEAVSRGVGGSEISGADLQRRPAGQFATFTTERGSTYTVMEDGTTIRDKAARTEHPGDEGIKPRTERTYYVDPADAQRLALPEGRSRIIDNEDGTLSIATYSEKQKRWGIAKSARNVPVTTEPTLGRSPVELWKGERVNGRPAYRSIHLGNKIKFVGTDAARQKPTALLTRREEPTLDQMIARAVQSGRDPRQVALADFRASAHAEEVVKAIPVDETAEVAEQFLEDAGEQANELRLALGLSDEDFAKVFAVMDADIAEAQALGRAARAAALCDLRS